MDGAGCVRRGGTRTGVRPVLLWWCLGTVLAGGCVATTESFTVVSLDSIGRVDLALHELVLRHRSAELVALMARVSAVGDLDHLVVIAAVFGLAAAAVTGRSRDAWQVLASLAAAALTVDLVKPLVGRSRPPLAGPALGAAFPSGHTTTTAAVAFSVALLVSRFDVSRRVRALGIAVVVAFACAVAMARVVLGVHWPTDVVAGLGLGAMCAFGSAAALGRGGSWPGHGSSRRRYRLTVARLLLVEDDELIARSLVRALESAGHSVEVAGTLARAREHGPVDLVLCDLGLPDGDGLDLVRDLAAANPSLPVIVLTARQDEVDVVAGLTTGAVDYVGKPFRLAELQARIDVHLRRTASSTRPSRVHVGGIDVDGDQRRVRVGGVEVELRPREFDLLMRLAVDAGRVVRREVLMHDVWDEHWFGSTKTLDVHIASLRAKLDRPGGMSAIETVRGVGYRLVDGGGD